MIKSGIDQDALIAQFTQATARQGEALRQAVCEATLKALQGRELTLTNIKSVLKSVTDAASAGTAKSGLPTPDAEAMLAKALDGMDAAVLQAVEANRRALQQFVDMGADLTETRMKKALSDLDKMEDAMFDTVAKAMTGATGPVQDAWANALKAARMEGSDAGARATDTIAQLTEQARSSVRSGRAASLNAAKALMDGYAAMVSGVLIGMAEGMQQTPAAKAAPRKTAKK